MDVHEPSSALDDATRQLLGNRAAANNNITLHLRFTEGRDSRPALPYTLITEAIDDYNHRAARPPDIAS